ncbi:hypothetical protein ACLB2K_001989 [Fragaria x ananassa]
MSTSNEIENRKTKKHGRIEDIEIEMQEATDHCEEIRHLVQEKAKHSRVEVEDIREYKEAITRLEEGFRKYKEALHVHGCAPPPGFHRQQENLAFLKETAQRQEDKLLNARQEAERGRNFVRKVFKGLLGVGAFYVF